MKTSIQSGKGFYAALSLSIAMVGAACWYAYSRTETKPPVRSEQSTVTSAVTTAATTTQTKRAATTATAPAEQAEEAAALLRRHTTTAAETTVTTAPDTTTATFPAAAETTAPVELPLAPVQGRVLLSFSHGELMKSATTGIWETHNGTDFAAAIGEDVCCTLDGTVTEIRRDPIWGVCVTVLHEDGTSSRYCGMNESLNVQSGDVLERGDVLGTVGNTNEAESAAETHLHFEVCKNGAYLDPEFFLMGVLPQETEAEAEE